MDMNWSLLNSSISASLEQHFLALSCGRHGRRGEMFILGTLLRSQQLNFVVSSIFYFVCFTFLLGRMKIISFRVCFPFFFWVLSYTFDFHCLDWIGSVSSKPLVVLVFLDSIVCWIVFQLKGYPVLRSFLSGRIFSSFWLRICFLCWWELRLNYDCSIKFWLFWRRLLSKWSSETKFLH